MTEVMIRTSERKLFKQCRQAWYWAYVEKIRRTEAMGSALSFGSMVHEALAAYYPVGRKRGPHPARNFEIIYDAYIEDGGRPLYIKGDQEEGNRWNARDLGVEMLTNYIKEYGYDDWVDVICPEQAFQIDVHDENGRYLYTYVGTADLTFMDRRNKQVGLMEHKTGAGLVPFGAPVELDEQSGSYWTYMPDWLKAQGVKKDLDFIMFNRLRKGFADVRPKDGAGRSLNKDGSISKKQPAPLFKREMIYRTDTDRANLMARVDMEAREMRMVRMGKLGVYKNPDRHCLGCEYRDMCELHETGADWQALLSQFSLWDPYLDHREVVEDE